jgi:hypothetical protein
VLGDAADPRPRAVRSRRAGSTSDGSIRKLGKSR